MTYVRQTKCRFSVILGAWDPPCRVFVLNTNDEEKARKKFKGLKEEEIVRLGGGEFSLRWYEHTPQSTMKYHRCHDEGEGMFVYNIFYEGSLVRDEFDYMDMAALTSDPDKLIPLIHEIEKNRV
jgi:hypothetical protein